MHFGVAGLLSQWALRASRLPFPSGLGAGEAKVALAGLGASRLSSPSGLIKCSAVSKLKELK